MGSGWSFVNRRAASSSTRPCSTNQPTARTLALASRKDCQTEIKNCYCMDTTIIPEPWGLPPTVTVVAMAKRLAAHLTVTQQVKVAAQERA